MQSTKLLATLALGTALAFANPYTRDASTNIVTDTINQIMWQDDTDAKTLSKSWSQATAYCDNLTLGGHDDWYLPSIKELESLVDDTRYNPTISPVFKYITSHGYYWSSSARASYPGRYWTMRFYNGKEGYYDQSGSRSVRCMRRY